MSAAFFGPMPLIVWSWLTSAVFRLTTALLPAAAFVWPTVPPVLAVPEAGAVATAPPFSGI